MESRAWRFLASPAAICSEDSPRDDSRRLERIWSGVMDWPVPEIIGGIGVLVASAIVEGTDLIGFIWKACKEAWKAILLLGLGEGVEDRTRISSSCWWAVCALVGRP